MHKSNEIFVAKIFNMPVFDTNGDQVGKVRDVVIIPSSKPMFKAVGLVIEVPGKRRIFTSFSHILTVTTSQVIISGLLNMRRFDKRKIEMLAFLDLLDQKIKEKSTQKTYIVEDLSIAKRGSEWFAHRFFVREPSPIFRRGSTRFFNLTDIDIEVSDTPQSSDSLLEIMEDLKPADVADVLQDLGDDRMKQVAHDLDNEKLADVLEELPEEDQIAILDDLDEERVADVLEEMEPDDAADVLGEMDNTKAQKLLDKMNPEEAQEVRDLLQYNKDSAGGLMTTNPIILAGDATVAQALSRISKPELSPSLASLVFVCNAPLEPPTGKLLGVLHFQQLLRNPPHRYLSEIVDTDYHFCSPHDSIDKVAVVFATYDAFMVPVLDNEKRLLGAISIDDLIDHMLPQNWREEE